MLKGNNRKALIVTFITAISIYMFGCIAPTKEVRKTYFPNGYPETTTEYEFGKKNGEFKQFFENGKIHLLRTYKDDVLDGKSCEYYPSGKIKEKWFFQKGRSVHLRLYNEDGELILTKD